MEENSISIVCGPNDALIAELQQYKEISKRILLKKIIMLKQNQLLKPFYLFKYQGLLYSNKSPKETSSEDVTDQSRPKSLSNSQKLKDKRSSGNQNYTKRELMIKRLIMRKKWKRSAKYYLKYNFKLFHLKGIINSLTNMIPNLPNKSKLTCLRKLINGRIERDAIRLTKGFNQLYYKSILFYLVDRQEKAKNILKNLLIKKHRIRLLTLKYLFLRFHFCSKYYFKYERRIMKLKGIITKKEATRKKLLALSFRKYSLKTKILKIKRFQSGEINVNKNNHALRRSLKSSHKCHSGIIMPKINQTSQKIGADYRRSCFASNLRQTVSFEDISTKMSLDNILGGEIIENIDYIPTLLNIFFKLKNHTIQNYFNKWKGNLVKSHGKTAHRTSFNHKSRSSIIRRPKKNSTKHLDYKHQSLLTLLMKYQFNPTIDLLKRTMYKLLGKHPRKYKCNSMKDFFVLFAQANNSIMKVILRKLKLKFMLSWKLFITEKMSTTDKIKFMTNFIQINKRSIKYDEDKESVNSKKRKHRRNNHKNVFINSFWKYTSPLKYYMKIFYKNTLC